MKIKILGLSFLAIILLISCKSPVSPEAASINSLDKVILEINGEVTKTSDLTGRCQMTGYIKNVGHATAYRVIARFKVYVDINKTIEIGIEGGGNWLCNMALFPGDKEHFDVRTIDLYPCEDIKALEIIIEYNIESTASGTPKYYATRQSQILTYIFD